MGGEPSPAEFLRPATAGLVFAVGFGLATAAAVVLGQTVMEAKTFFDSSIAFVGVAVSAGAVLVGCLIGFASARSSTGWVQGSVCAAGAAVLGYPIIILLLVLATEFTSESPVDLASSLGELIPFVLPAMMGAATTGAASSAAPARGPRAPMQAPA